MSSGANGSGKSTLLKLLAGIVRPTRGTVEVRGRLAALLELGAGFHPEISGRENVEITGLLLGLTRREIAARFDDIVRFAGVEAFLDAPVKTYSSGMAVRLGFRDRGAQRPGRAPRRRGAGRRRRGLRPPGPREVFRVRARGKDARRRFARPVARGRSAAGGRIWLERGRIASDGPAPETVARYLERVAVEEGERRLAEIRPGARVGSGVATIGNVRLLDAAGRPAGRFRAGEPASIEMTVSAAEPLSDFVFGFRVTTVAGVVVLGTNTELEGFRPGRFEGEARVTLAVPVARSRARRLQPGRRGPRARRRPVRRAGGRAAFRGHVRARGRGRLGAAAALGVLRRRPVGWIVRTSRL